MERPAILSEIKKEIQNAKIGTVFVPIDFALITDKKTASVSLSRLEKEKIVLKIMRGIYYKAEYNNFLDEYVAPEADAVAHALSRNYGWTIVPCGDTALNRLGLSTQIPAAWGYVSDGPYKDYTYNQTTIKFKRTTNKEISKLSYKTALVVQALKALGNENINDSVITKLKNTLTEEEKKTMLTEAKAVTSWIFEYIKMICRS
ncbi:MAG: hypothetical protein J6A43_01360 [Clostridia bacterium]|nr:hypothetical protein [Clostridia bacterium]MBO5432687.1 hypothetical protein [Clostridia bacterium]